MREENKEEELKYFKINKNKPMQLKRNLFIEKYVEKFLRNHNNIPISNICLKTFRNISEETKNNCFIKKKPISQKKYLLKGNEDTDSTTIISSYIAKKTPSKIYKRNTLQNLSGKARTISYTNIQKDDLSKIIIHKKNAGKSFSLRSNSKKAHNTKQKHYYIQRNRNVNTEFFRKYERVHYTYNTNNKDLIRNNKMKSSSFFHRNNSINKSNTYQAVTSTTQSSANTNNLIKYNPEKNINLFNITKTLKEINLNSINKIHKEINIEDFLLISKKFEQIKNILSNIKNYYKKIENEKTDEVDINEIYSSCNFHIYDLYKFYMNSSIEGSPENLFSSLKTKKILHECSIIFILNLVTIYICNLFNNCTYINKNIILLNIQQKIFLLVCDAILKKLNSKYNNNIWRKKLQDELNDKLIFNIDDNISQIVILSQDSYKLNNDIIESIHKYITLNNNIIKKDIKKVNIFLFLYNNFYKKDLSYFDSLKIIDVEELINKNIFKIDDFHKNNILENFYCINNNEYLDTNRYSNIDTVAPYLKFPCKKEYTLILDLDETMICFKCPKEEKNVGNIHIRPGLELFLEIIKEFYEIIIFTVGTKEYANVILDLIEKKNNTKFFDGRLYREHATKIGNKYIKDLSKIGRDLSKTLIVDNNPHSFKFQHENGILINAYFGEKSNDKALIELQKILIKIYKDKSDVRYSISKYKEEIIKKVSFPNE